jgi:predicted nuclease of predicted toxin-antitoxin system
LADECIGAAIVAGLRERGLDALDAKDVCRGDDDERVLALAEGAGRVVITHDWGFGEMSIRQAN